MQLFYNPDISKNTKQFSFSKNESKHIVKVLRKKQGDLLHITNGKGYLFISEISIADIKKCTVTLKTESLQPKPKYNLHLAVALTKMNERYEWFLEKATEIGIHSITPIICEHNERKIVKHDRFEKKIISALKQSQHYYLPQLNPTISFKLFLKQKFNGQLFIAHCEALEKKSLKHQLQSQQNVTILIGPEGDFSVKEIKMALQNKFIPVTLGTHRLRTETAAIVACHSVAFINE